MAAFRCDWGRLVEPRIQYAKTKDWVSIAYATVGKGETARRIASLGVLHRAGLGACFIARK